MGGFCLIICSFWGHQTLYDLDLADRVQNAIAQVVAQDDEIEFRLFSTGSFAPICLSAAMEAKQRYRNKRISLVLIRMPRPDTAAWADSTDPLTPLCAFERILQTAPCHNAQEALQVIHHLLRQSPLFNTLLVCGAVGTAATPAFHSRPLPGTGSGRCTDRPGHYGRLLPALRGRAAGRRGHRSGPLPVRSLHAITPLPVHNPSAASRRASKAALYRAQPDGPAVYCQWSRFSQNLRHFVSPNHR